MKEKQNRTEKVTIRLTPDELERLRELSYGSYRLMADYCRDCIFGREITVIPGFDEAAEQLRRIGTNLNQLTRLANLREISVVNLTETKAESAQAEFEIVKSRFNKSGGRNYYHVIQSFAPEDDLTPEEAHDIGMELAGFFNSFQVLVVTHTDRGHLHNHLVVNSVSHADGKKLHTSRDDLLRVKAYSNKLCARRGLSTTETKSGWYRFDKWKDELVRVALMAMALAETRESFIEYMENHGYDVKWIPDHKYITFTTPDGKRVRDNKLFDERLLKGNLELYFAMGGCASVMGPDYWNYQTPAHDEKAKETVTTGLLNIIGDLLCQEDGGGYTPRPLTEMDKWEKERLEKILGKRISNEAYFYYCTKEDYEHYAGLSM